MSKLPLEKYPRLYHAMKYCGNLTPGETAAALLSIMRCGVDGVASSDAAQHFGGHRALIKRAWQSRNLARRYAGHPMWAQWKDKPMTCLGDTRSPRELVTSRFAQLHLLLDQLGCDKHYSRTDLAIDLETISKKSATEHDTYLLFVRENGTHLVDLKLPRSATEVEQIWDSSQWRGVYRFSLSGGAVQMTASQAMAYSQRNKPYQVLAKSVMRPNGDTLASFELEAVNHYTSDVRIRLAGWEWSLFKMRRPVATQTELAVIERCILDSMITASGSLFSRIRRVSYEIDANTVLDAQDFYKFYAEHFGTVCQSSFLQLHHKTTGLTQIKALPIGLDDMDDALMRAKAMIEEYKAEIKRMFGALKGNTFALVHQGKKIP